MMDRSDENRAEGLNGSTRAPEVEIPEPSTRPLDVHVGLYRDPGTLQDRKLPVERVGGNLPDVTKEATP